MPENPFGFLLDLPTDQGKEWLSRYLAGEAVEPAVRVPFDMTPAIFLISQVNPMPEPALPLRIGTLAGTLLAEVITAGAHRGAAPEKVATLFTLVESLPVSPGVAGFLNDLAATGRLLDVSGSPETDLHLLALRAMVAHQRAPQGEIGRLIAFWRWELDDPRYAPVAMQGLFRISVAEGLKALPRFVRDSLAARPVIPLANTLFVVSEVLGDDRSLWRDLVAAFHGWDVELAAVKEAFGRSRLPQSNLAAWQALQAKPVEAPGAVGYVSLYSRRDDAGIELALRHLPGALLAPAGA